MSDVKFGCVMLYFNAPALEIIQESINEDDIHENGLENDPHITLLYGLHDTVSLEEVEEIINNYTFGYTFFSDLSLFECEEYDVLKFNPFPTYKFRRINEELRTLPNTVTFDEYIPHMTVAYLKKGRGKKYTDIQVLFEVKPKYVMYSLSDSITQFKIEI